MKHYTRNHQSIKAALSLLLYEQGFILMSKDTEVIERIFNLLTENKNTHKIEGLISTTEITKYGGKIHKSEAKELCCRILKLAE